MRIRFISAAAAVIASAALVGCDPAEPTEQGAAVMCEQFVEKRLKSPGSAEFAGVSETKIETLSDKKPWKYRVAAHVDSQNGFGAEIRNEYVCTISTEDNDTWTLDDLKFTGR